MGCGPQMGMGADGCTQSVQLRANSQQFANSQFNNANLPNNAYSGGQHQVGPQNVESPSGMGMPMGSDNQGSVPGDQSSVGGGAGQMVNSAGAPTMKTGMMVPKGGAMYGPGHQRSTPYPNPQQYMLSKRAQLINGQVQPEVCGVNHLF